jgi:nicotinamidase-related amidase
MKTAVLVIDMIEEFVTGRLDNPRARAVVPRVKRLLGAARGTGSKVVYVTDAHLPGIDHEFQVWGAHAEAGSPGAKIVPELKSEPGDYRLDKRRYSAFYATGLDELLRELKIEAVILTGVVTNICIQHTAADAYYRGYKVIVPEDCVDALTNKEQADSLAYMKRMYGAEVTDSDKLIKRLEASQ